MNAIEALLAVYDIAIDDEFESLTSAISGLTEDESVWQPPAYKQEPHDEGVGRPGTILWQLNHVEMYHRQYTDILTDLGSKRGHDAKPPGELPLKQALTALKKTNANLRKAIAGLKPEDLTRPVRPGRSVASFIASIAAHACWHAGQIRQTRRLWAKR